MTRFKMSVIISRDRTVLIRVVNSWAESVDDTSFFEAPHRNKKNAKIFEIVYFRMELDDI